MILGKRQRFALKVDVDLQRLKRKAEEKAYIGSAMQRAIIRETRDVDMLQLLVTVLKEREGFPRCTESRELDLPHYGFKKRDCRQINSLLERVLTS